MNKYDEFIAIHKRYSNFSPHSRSWVIAMEQATTDEEREKVLNAYITQMSELVKTLKPIVERINDAAEQKLEEARDTPFCGNCGDKLYSEGQPCYCDQFDREEE